MNFGDVKKKLNNKCVTFTAPKVISEVFSTILMTIILKITVIYLLLENY